MTNEHLMEYYQKAMATAGQLAAGGLLNAEQSNQFLDYVVDVTELRGSVRMVRIDGQQKNIDKIGVGNRVTVPKEEARDPGFRAGVTTSQVVLNTFALMTPFEISDEFGESNIEGEDVEDHIIRMMATQTANDIEELAIDGDVLGHARLENYFLTGGSATQVVQDTLLAKFNGWLRLLDAGNVYDATGANVCLQIFSKMLQAMPPKFRRTRRNLRWLVSMDLEQIWREKFGARATPAGDNAATTDARIPVFGIPMVPVPMLEAEPLVVEHITFGAAPATMSLRYKPIGATVIVCPSTLGKVPTTPYLETTDYTVNRTLGTITTVGGGALNAGATVKVTYNSLSQIALTEMSNLIFCLSRDVKIETGREIFKSVNQFAITTRPGVQIEEVTATVKGINIGLN